MIMTLPEVVLFIVEVGHDDCDFRHGIWWWWKCNEENDFDDQDNYPYIRIWGKKEYSHLVGEKLLVFTGQVKWTSENDDGDDNDKANDDKNDDGADNDLSW